MSFWQTLKSKFSKNKVEEQNIPTMDSINQQNFDLTLKEDNTMTGLSQAPMPPSINTPIAPGDVINNGLQTEMLQSKQTNISEPGPLGNTPAQTTTAKKSAPKRKAVKKAVKKASKPAKKTAQKKVVKKAAPKKASKPAKKTGKKK